MFARITQCVHVFARNLSLPCGRPDTCGCFDWFLFLSVAVRVQLQWVYLQISWLDDLFWIFLCSCVGQRSSSMWISPAILPFEDISFPHRPDSMWCFLTEKENIDSTSWPSTVLPREMGIQHRDVFFCRKRMQLGSLNPGFFHRSIYSIPYTVYLCNFEGIVFVVAMWRINNKHNMMSNFPRLTNKFKTKNRAKNWTKP